LIETLEGKGKVFDGDAFVANVQFKIRVYQRYDVSNNLSGGISHVPTLRRHELDISAPSKPIPMSLQAYTLHTKDGRKLKFIMSSPTTTTATGGIF
jgi:hypothetical protein